MLSYNFTVLLLLSCPRPRKTLSFAPTTVYNETIQTFSTFATRIMFRKKKQKTFNVHPHLKPCTSLWFGNYGGGFNAVIHLKTTGGWPFVEMRPTFSPIHWCMCARACACVRAFEGVLMNVSCANVRFKKDFLVAPAPPAGVLHLTLSEFNVINPACDTLERRSPGADRCFGRASYRLCE